ncbi:G2 and S phase-expressed protein 1 isoform X3 [Austrofundulus limnaeus]|uniref:G2 and S phase-expressed protein 1 isoform X3 n=1 Tax=Austrofundulus limnaeus TaxID=52670 RepID=A0A2I4C9Y8_AUSLI|nr:PREDICTED: G2 and S phase-expressed protein 1 isoform X3 [Austrofundulus limnaeus]
MDLGVNDLCLLQDEKFDFNVSLSPASLTGDNDDDDDDEVFVGVVSHEERCVSVGVTSQLEQRSSGSPPRVSWSPLTGDQMEAVCQEAHRLANQLQSEAPCCEHPQTTTNTNTETSAESDQFVQDSGTKLGLLGQTTRVLSPIKRQTFCVQDSPMKQLPPAIQRQLLRGRSSSTASSARPAAPSRLSTSSPAARAKAQSRTSLRGRSTLGAAAVLPSKPVAPATSCSANKSKVEKSRLQPPSKTSGFLRQSPSMRPPSRAESSEDLLSDSASVASDVSDSSINSCLLGKHTLAPPTKSVGVRKLSGVKAPPPQSRRMTDRRNTSSSSSSVSSFNSSLSLSPAKGKPNSSLNQTLSSSTGPTPSSVSRPANQSRPLRSTAYSAAEASSSRRSLSFHAKKLPEGERGGATRSTPLKRAETTPPQLTPPTKRLLQRTASLATMGPARLQNGVKTKPKPETLTFTTPGSADGSKMLKPKRFLSTGSTDGSLLQKSSAAPLTASVGSYKPLQASQRPSSLPTPVKRRMSAMPASGSQTRTAGSPTVADSTIRPPTPPSVSKLQCCSPDLKNQPAHPPDIQPFRLEEEPPVVNSPPKPPEPSQTENTDPGGLRGNEPAPTKNLMDLETTDDSSTQTQEALLLDLSPPTLQPQEKLLIDLTNTPDLVRTNIKSCTTTQLIDLSSPLIKWSPEEKKNDAPLINLSF